MDKLSVKSQAVCTNFSYLKGEDLKLSKKDSAYLTPGRSLEDPHATMLGYDVMGSLSSALSYQQEGSLFYWSGEMRERKEKKREKKAPVDNEERAGPSSKDSVALENHPPPELSENEDIVENIQDEEEMVCFTPGGNSSLLEKLLVTSDENVFYAIASLFQKVPVPILSRCAVFESKLYVLEKGKKLWPALIPLSAAQLELPGGYVPNLKAGFLHKEALTIPSMQNLPLVLMAHMYDHALGGDNFASLKSPAVYSLYLGCRQRKAGHQFLSGYSEAGPVQYFAQSMASYFSPDHYRYKLFTREIFKTIDPAMYEYMTCLFGPV